MDVCRQAGGIPTCAHYDHNGALIRDAFLEHAVMAPKYLPAVPGTYFRSPEHAERFPLKNRWRLYNAFTETFKQESVTLQADSFRALGRALCTKHN
jgi:hypothetical protein